jgi:hypothetical protein
VQWIDCRHCKNDEQAKPASMNGQTNQGKAALETYGFMRLLLLVASRTRRAGISEERRSARRCVAVQAYEAPRELLAASVAESAAPE